MFVVFLFACSATKTITDAALEDTATTDPPTYYQDVAPIIAKNCLTCHLEGKIGPFALDTYENVKILGPSVANSVTSRRMPPYLADNSGDCQTYKDATWLTEEEIQTIDDWYDGGMLEGDPSVSTPLPEEEEALDATHSLTFDVYEANFATSADDYRCFIVDPELEEDAYLTAFEVLPSNKAIAHHMILYSPVNAAAIQDAYAQDAADAGQGYSCYGGANVNSYMVAPWAPGKSIWSYPQGTGIKLKANTPLIIQMHYSNASEDTLDATVVNLKLEEQVEKELFTEFYIHAGLEIPGNTPEHVESRTRSVRSITGRDQSIELYSLVPHMHKLGSSEYASVIAPDGEETCLIDVPNWDFNWQLSYTFENSKILNPDDRVFLECTFDSTGIAGTTYWGDGTGDEMCLIGMFYSIAD